MKDKINTHGGNDTRSTTEVNKKSEKTKAGLELNEFSSKLDFSYDTDLLENFLRETVFHTLPDDAEILTFRTRKGAPGYPDSLDDTLALLKRTGKPMALYYSTASAVPDKNGKLRNRKTQFKAMHALVLDDIGTKVSPDKIPENLEPTYIIESSEGNFQWGYVFEEPIEELELAQALVQAVYEAGFSDAGGRLANKVVRLPGGVNGKQGAKQMFHVKLHDDQGPFWTPEDLLDRMDIGVRWADLVNDPQLLAKRRKSRQGTVAWSPASIEHASLDGIVDPVVEWLEEKDLIMQDGDEWIDVQCPWHFEHSDGNDAAGYSPVGRGSQRLHRAFHCFHEHCADRTTADFLQWVAAEGGPEVPSFDPVADAVATYAIDPLENGFWHLGGRSVPMFISAAGFRLQLPGSATVYNAEGKAKQVSKVKLLTEHPYRVAVHGHTYDPTTEAKIVQSKEGEMRINRYSLPEWGDGEYDPEQVKRFTDFMQYLLPNEEEYLYVMDWLAAKAQSMGFRGPAILMVATAQGTGRTTLSMMLNDLFGQHNCETVPFEKLTDGGNYNEFLLKPMIFSNETLAVAKDDSIYKVYERMKEMIDTTPTEMRINPKYGKQSTQFVYSSFMFFSNHLDAIYAAANDRRLYVARNPDTPAPIQYFIELHEWLDAKDETGAPAWCKHVWRYLRQQSPNMDQLLLPPVTQTKSDMINKAKGELGYTIHKMLDHWPLPVITTNHVKTALLPHLMRMGVEVNERTLNKLIGMHTDAVTKMACNGKKFKYNGKAVRMRLIRDKVVDADGLPIPTKSVSDDWVHDQVNRLRDADETRLKEILAEAIEDALGDLEI